MRKLYATPSLSECDVLKSILESNEIKCFIKNETNWYATASVVADTMPEIWIINDDQFEEALAILTESKSHKPESKET